jgi:hypothetical protein
MRPVRTCPNPSESSVSDGRQVSELSEAPFRGRTFGRAFGRCFVIASTRHDWEQIGQQWDLPRLAAWNRMTGNLPPLAMMVGRYLGYKAPDVETKPMTQEEHAKRLLGQLGMSV